MTTSRQATTTVVRRTLAELETGERRWLEAGTTLHSPGETIGGLVRVRLADGRRALVATDDVEESEQ